MFYRSTNSLCLQPCQVGMGYCGQLFISSLCWGWVQCCECSSTYPEITTCTPGRPPYNLGGATTSTRLRIPRGHLVQVISGEVCPSIFTMDNNYTDTTRILINGLLEVSFKAFSFHYTQLMSTTLINLSRPRCNICISKLGHQWFR